MNGFPSCALASGESSNSGPSHAGPVAADAPELQLGDAPMRHEIPVLPERLRLACQQGFFQVLRVLARERRVSGADSLEVVAVGAADLRKVKPALVQPIDLRGTGAAGDRWVEGFYRVEVDVRRGMFHDAVEGAESDATGQHGKGMNRDRQSALLVDLADRPIEGGPHRDGLFDEERQQVPMEGGDLAGGHDLEAILVGNFLGLVAAREAIVVGDRHHVQVGAIANVVEHLPDGGGTVVQRGMNVEVGFAHEFLLNRPQRLAPAVTEWGRPGRQAFPARSAPGRGTWSGSPFFYRPNLP